MKLMGILNVTPDSFSDGGKFLDSDAAVEHGLALFAEGADIVDVGGESTRPGAAEVSIDEELTRVIPVVEALAKRGPVSIDTTKKEVASLAAQAGATIINDISASLASIAVETNSEYILMHMQGTPRTMQESPTYKDVVAEVHEFLFERAIAADQLGVKKVYVDPGIGFGKTTTHNLLLLNNLPLVGGQFPLVVGASRKSFIGSLAGGVDAAHRLPGSLAIAIKCAQAGVEIIRVHDVAATRQALLIWNEIEAAKQ